MNSRNQHSASGLAARESGITRSWAGAVIGVVMMLLSSAVLCAADEAPTPVATDNQMLKKYVWSTIGLDGVLNATLSSSLDQWQNSPPEWEQHGTGYTRRWVSNYAESAIGDGTKYAVAHFFHQDPSYYRCECTGAGRRLHHAVDSPFMGRKRDGTRVLSAASLAGILAGHIVPDATWYPALHGSRDGLKHAGTSLLTQIGIDVIKEFWPR